MVKAQFLFCRGWTPTSADAGHLRKCIDNKKTVVPKKVHGVFGLLPVISPFRL